MLSSVSAGRRGFGIAVSVYKTLCRLFWRLINLIYRSFFAYGFPIAFFDRFGFACVVRARLRRH